MLELIKELLEKVWDIINKITLRIISFVKNIVSFFKNRSRLRKLAEDRNRIAVAIKDILEKGDYQVVNCLYDKQENDLVDPEEDAQVMTAEELDDEARQNFAHKPMLLLQ